VIFPEDEPSTARAVMGLIVIRLLIGFTLPLAIGSEVFAVLALVSEANGNVTLDMLPAMIIGGVIFFPFALIVMGIQSLVYSLLMEFVINPLISTKSIVYLISLFLGVVSSCTISCGYSALVGAVAGLLSGFVLRSIYTFEPNPDG
jgi:hypothetical protein